MTTAKTTSIFHVMRMNSRSCITLIWILAVLLIVYPNNSKGSSEAFVSPCKGRYVGDCQFEVTCDHKAELSWRDVQDVGRKNSSMSCHGYTDMKVILNNVLHLTKIKLTYNTMRFQSIYSNNNNIEIPYVQGLPDSRVIELNISSSKLENVPVFYEMGILKTINMSYNYLPEAKLYNERPLKSLKVLDYSHNRIVSFDKGIGSHAFDGLTLLNLSYNMLEAVPAGTFQYQINLKSLDLSFNKIESFNINSFDGPTQLQKLYLSSNRIDNCAFLLQRLDELEELHLDGNNIKYIGTGEFEHLKRLRILILSSNSITSISNNLFKNLNLLETLALNNNSLEKINKNSFADLENLKNVDLSYNNIETLYRNLFKGNNISSFSIEGNKIKGSLGKGVFEGLFLVSELNLSNQRITGIEDYTFYMLKELISLDISRNQIKNLSKFSFKTLTKLFYLDLSDNCIADIDFEKQDLFSLKSLNLRNNFIHQLSLGVFMGLGDLQELYLSRNKIGNVTQNVFQPLSQLVTIELSNNPLEGDLKADSFNGLHSLENLDLSCSLLNMIKSNAFGNMESLKYLNVSHGNVTELENDIFGGDTSLKILDLSHNNLNTFSNTSNITSLNHVKELYLNNNLLSKINESDFDGLHKISKLTISYNKIEEIELHSFDKLGELQNLDLSFNPKLLFMGSVVQNNRKLETLHLSGTRNPIKCTDMEDLPILELMLSSSNISDLRSVDFFKLNHLITLDLSRNTIRRIEVEVFNNFTNLRLLDLSFNQIISIQPGSFKGNTHLNILNISHNQIETVTHGTFRGMEHVLTIDLSFNNLKTLSSDQFLEIPNIKILIVDSNKLERIKMDNLPGLEILSLGDNQLQCKYLSKFISEQSIIITTIRIDFHSANVQGITCYHESDAAVTDLSDVSEYNGNSSSMVALLKVLSDIRNMMHSINNSHAPASPVLPNVDNSDFSKALISRVQNFTLDVNKLSDVSSANTNRTNKILSRMLDIMTVTAQASVKSPADFINTSSVNVNATAYLDNLKKDFELKNLFLNNKVVDLEEKIAVLVSRFENKIKITNETEVKKEKLIVESDKLGVDNGHTTFMEVCVVFILVILIAILLYKLYEFGAPKLRRRSQRTASTRGITESIENSNF